MKKIVLAAMLIGCSTAYAQVTVDFEDIELKADTFDNGASLNGADFVSGGFVFTSDYHSAGDYWDGFSISTQTSTEFKGLQDQYNSCVGCGADSSKTYAVYYHSAWADKTLNITQAEGKHFTPQSIALTNAAYAFSSMLHGDSYAKKFTEKDWFQLHIIGKKNGAVTDTVTVDLASDGNIIFTWKQIDLSKLGEVDAIQFSMASSDAGQWGMNTPAYVCFDNFTSTVGSTITKISSSKPSKGTTIEAIFNAEGVQQSQLLPGINLVRMSDGSMTKIYK